MSPSRRFWVALLTLFSSGCSDLPSGPARDSHLPGTIYVDAAAGHDELGTGRDPESPYRTIGRALLDIPSLVDTAWTIVLAPGEYREAVELHRFVMPSALNFFQLRHLEEARSLRIRSASGQAADVLIIPPAADRPCVTAVSVVLFLEGVTCRVSGYQGITASGATLVLDDVRLDAIAPASNALYVEDTSVYLGGSIEVTGPFLQGLAIRTNSFARSGTRLNPKDLSLLFRDVELAIFLRDGANFTNAFEDAVVRAENVREIAYAILDSRLFFSTGVKVEGVALRGGEGSMHHRGVFGANHQSGINIHTVKLTGEIDPLIRCHKDSYVIIESGSYEGIPEADTDGTCSVRY